MNLGAGLSTEFEFAPAKINFALHVIGRRADGYHLIETLAVFADFGDRLAASPASSDGFFVEGAFAAEVPLDGRNLVLRARDTLRTAFPQAGTPPVAISLEKRLPVASGIGGGSSDAAAALRMLARHWRLDVNAEELAAIAAGLGADVPMCLACRPLIASGVGERLSPIEGFPHLPMVLVNPGVAVATADVFRRLARRDNAPLPPLRSRNDLAGLLEWLRATRNDLADAAVSLAPEIGAVLSELREGGAAFARMSGSGATCVGIYPTLDEAKRAAARIAGRQPGWFVVATTSAGQELIR